MEYELTQHAKYMLQERNIPEEWLRRTLISPDNREIGGDGNLHYIKAIPEHGERFLRVVVNATVTPNRVVTIFFDRRLGRKQ